jgi:hypothetical protein
MEMILDGMLVGFGAFGVAAFCFVAGFVVGGSRNDGASVFPATHVSFGEDLSDEGRLEFLDSAKKAVLLGQLRKSKQLGDDATSNQG